MKARILLLLAALPLIAATPVFKVQLRTAHGAKVVELPLERYVAAVLAGESSVFQSKEALKAMAVAARTYAVRLRGRHGSEGFDFCDTTHCQRLDMDAAASPRLESAAAETSGELLWFQGKPAFTPYTRDCGGQTEDAAAVWPDLAAPYLKSHPDSYCTRAGNSGWRWSAGASQIADALRRSGLRSPRSLYRISIVSRTPSGRAATLLLTGGAGAERISAGSLRFAVGRELGWNTLRSDHYEVRTDGQRMVFDGTGAGHGVGLCQRGAEQMGLAGSSYLDILAFYYPGTLLGLSGRGLSWQRLNGETITLASVRPSEDRIVLETAERLARTRMPWQLPAHVEIRVYPDLDTFRDATGEPGWVAAHTSGLRIQLQPTAVLKSRDALESTLRHELLHMVVESQAQPSLPVWFREGLVGFLDTGRGTGVARIPLDSELRQTGDAKLARSAYADATASVANLVERYGEATVLGWVKRGLPPEVTNPTPSQAATKKR